MKISVAINLPLSTWDERPTKQTDSELWRSFGGFPVGRRKGQYGGNIAGINKFKW